MARRFVSIWFRHLSTDWFSLRQSQLREVPFVLRAPAHGKMVITAANAEAERTGIHVGMVLADARAIFPDLNVWDDKPDLIDRLIRRLAEWCIRFTPIAVADPPDGLLLDASGCAHLWGGEQAYLTEIVRKLNERGYDVRAAMADTPGVAWGVARFWRQPVNTIVVGSGNHRVALSSLPPEALRLEPEISARLHRLGLQRISQFIGLQRNSLRRRFGAHFIKRLDLALGREEEVLKPVIPAEPYQERLHCLEPIITARGIEIALQQLLETLCYRLQQDQKGLRSAVFKGYRADDKVEKVDIGTHRASHHVGHIFKLFEIKLSMIDPGPGIELFLLEAPAIEDHYPRQEKLWEGSGGLEDIRLFELIDRLAGKVGTRSINRFIPEEHYWPERSFSKASTFQEKSLTAWRTDKLRPLRLLSNPEKIEVTAPIPDYPPMLFRYKGKVHQVTRADGPERIEQEWWLQQGQHRDYYRVEDEEGKRYWIFRLGHYNEKRFHWFLHGFFA